MRKAYPSATIILISLPPVLSSSLHHTFQRAGWMLSMDSMGIASQKTPLILFKLNIFKKTNVSQILTYIFKFVCKMQRYI